VDVNLFDYSLPMKAIAQKPMEPRDHSRMMVLNRNCRSIEHRRFYDLPDFLLPGDLLVVNNTRVIPARLKGHKENGVEVEIFLLHPVSGGDQTTWKTLMRPGKRVKEGTRILFENSGGEATCERKYPDGSGLFRFFFPAGKTPGQWFAQEGQVPLPPYIFEELEQPERYQTVYASREGAVAAPTAGLHFTPALLQKIAQMGIQTVEVTLHVGPGTFRPVKTAQIEDHTMHSESFFVPHSAAAEIFAAREQKRRIIAVGTTSVRVLESLGNSEPAPNGDFQGTTDIFLYPPHDFCLVDGLITNFHLPKSTLLMLVSAFAGREFILDAYQEALETGYRFFSFGDATLLL